MRNATEKARPEGRTTPAREGPTSGGKGRLNEDGGRADHPARVLWRNFGVDLSVVRHAKITIGPFEDGAKVGDYAFSEPEMEVNLKVTPSIAFRDEGPAEGRHALRTLTEIRRHIESVVVPKLERFF